MLAPPEKKVYPCPCCGQAIEYTKPLVDLSTNVVAWRGALQLTRQEADLVMILTTRTNRVVAYETIITELFGQREHIESRKCMQVVICGLRKKLPTIGIQIETVHDRGYRLVPESLSPLFVWQT